MSTSRRIVIDARRIVDFGVGTYIRNLVQSLSAIDSVNRYVLVARPGDAGGFPQLGSNFEVVPYRGPESNFARSAVFPLFLAKFQADVYHIPIGIVPTWMPRPYVVTVHDLTGLLYQTQRNFRHTIRFLRFQRALKRADQIVVVSDATLRDVASVGGVAAHKIRRIYNAPDPVFTSQPKRDDCKELQRLLERYQVQYPFLLYAGTIRPHKNIPRLIEAFAVLRSELETHSQYRDLRLIIIGDEISKYPDVRRTVIQSRVEKTVRFLGFVPIETLRLFYKAAKAFVFPSLYEGFGLPPLEAMACGTPVVTSSVSSLPEVGGDAAMFVNPESVFDIARGMREVLLNDDLRASLIHKGLQRAVQFNWLDAGREVLRTYEDCVRSPAHRSKRRSTGPVL